LLKHKLAPVAWPIAKLLDFVLGTNSEHTYKKAELKSFLQFHRTGEEPLRDAEIAILNGVLELNTKNVEEIMTPLKVCTLSLSLVISALLKFCDVQDTLVLSADTILDYSTIDKLCVSLCKADFVFNLPFRSMMTGYSRFPVHEPGKPLAFVGTLLVKKVRVASGWSVLDNFTLPLSSLNMIRARPSLFQRSPCRFCLKQDLPLTVFKPSIICKLLA